MRKQEGRAGRDFLALYPGVLRTLEERMGLVGRVIVKLIGIAWTLACYFVVPVLAFEDLTPFAAVKRSARLFKDTWGERVAGGFGIGAVFLVLALPGIGVWIAVTLAFSVEGMLIGLGLLFLYLLLLSVANLGSSGHLQRRLVPLCLLQAGAPGIHAAAHLWSLDP